MRFEIKGPFKENIYGLMRKIGYHSQSKGEKEDEFSFVSPPFGFPRFHLYLKEKNENLIFNLHLDQKKASYAGSSAHSGEYESRAVKEEAQRIKKELTKAG